MIMVNRLVPIYYLYSPFGQRELYTFKTNIPNGTFFIFHRKSRIFVTTSNKFFSPPFSRPGALQRRRVSRKMHPRQRKRSFLFFLRNEKVRNKSVRKTRGVGARFTGRGSYVSRIFTNAASKQIYRGIGTRYFHHARERERRFFAGFDRAVYIDRGGKQGAGIKLILDQDIEPAETDDLCRYYFAAGH